MKPKKTDLRARVLRLPETERRLIAAELVHKADVVRSMERNSPFDRDRWTVEAFSLSEPEREAIAAGLESNAAIVLTTTKPVHLTPDRQRWTPAEN